MEIEKTNQLKILAESYGSDWGRRFGLLLDGANNFFSKISEVTDNKSILVDILSNDEARQRLVEILEEGEKGWNFDARTSPELQIVVQSLGLELPQKPKDLRRWVLLVAAAASLVEGFSYGNLIQSEDITRKR